MSKLCHKLQKTAQLSQIPALVKKIINIEIGARVKEQRKALRYTREALAELVDISPQFLADIECGKKGMSFTTLKKMCGRLGVSCDYLIMGERRDSEMDRIENLISGLDNKYISVVEDIVRDAVRLISAAESV